jgi:protein-S-isoprenylcysteine O-methyltransferase Ste14
MDARRIFFKLRSYTPIPLLILLVLDAHPGWTPFLLGLGFMALGEIVRMWGVAHAGGATRTRDVGAPDLVTSGPFAHTRNPLYIGNALIYIGVVLLAGGQLLWIIIALGFCTLQYGLIVSLEEETLVNLFDFEYEFYRRGVPRWRPRLTQWPWSLPRSPDWKDAWRNEKHTRINLLAAVIVFALIGIF